MTTETIRQLSEKFISKDPSSSVVRDIETLIMGAAELHAMLKELTSRLHFVLSNAEKVPVETPSFGTQLTGLCELSVRLNEANKSILTSRDIVSSLFTNLEI